jgi:hypothetical protein
MHVNITLFRSNYPNLIQNLKECQKKKIVQRQFKVAVGVVL